MSSGRDAILYDANSPLQHRKIIWKRLNLAEEPTPGDIQSVVQERRVLAGRNLDPRAINNADGTSVGIASTGNGRNPSSV